jgi:hypothetical protein
MGFLLFCAQPRRDLPRYRPVAPFGDDTVLHWSNAP